jgi:FKBP-type peptidyl-prolyl cis-trans isomerase FkpA
MDKDILNKVIIGLGLLLVVIVLLKVNTGEDNMELKIEILQEGTGDKVVAEGDSITVHYTGTLEDGTKFDSSVDRDDPFKFTIGRGMVIQGWEQGLLGMKISEKRKITIPSELGYGASGAGGVIPPNATLIFEVELISID